MNSWRLLLSQRGRRGATAPKAWGASHVSESRAQRALCVAEYLCAYTPRETQGAADESRDRLVSTAHTKVRRRPTPHLSRTH
mmetsp:Transcript_12803/g.35191  ORF Transcript_12803/g.35191 Transcript_12803/m.35191 type:complete len:82 (-) Transcript_12803:2314-2559(-)